MSGPIPSSPPEEAAPVDVLRTPEAGGKVIRGGIVRTLGFGGGSLLAAIASVFLLRHLGVVEFGRYVTVMSLVAIVGGITEGGLSVVGSREMAVLPPGPERLRVARNIVGIRLVLTPLGILGAVGFAALAGYGGRLVLGTLLAGVGLLLVSIQSSMILSLSVELKNGRVAFNELFKQAVTAIGIAALSIAGAGLLPFFVVQIAVGVGVLAITPFLLSRRGIVAPAFDRSEWRTLALHALPLAAAFVLGQLYFRMLVIVMSLLATAEQTGLFATSFRILEMLVGIPLLLAGVVLPVASAAAHDAGDRLRYVLQRVAEGSLVVSTGLALAVSISAPSVVVILGGGQYSHAAPILSIEAWALVGVFMSQAFTVGLLAMRRQRAIALSTTMGLVTIVALGLVLVPLAGGKGAAAAGVAADAALAVATYVLLARTRRDLRLGLGPVIAKTAAAAALAAPIALVPGISPLVLAIAAGCVYAALAWLFKAVPPEVLPALRAPLGSR